MSDLRNKLIRLAHNNPELRTHLLPLVKEAGRDIYWCNPQWGCGEEYTEREADRLFAKGDRTGRPTECPNCGAKATIEVKDHNQKRANQMRLPIKLGNSHIRYRFEDGGKRLMVVMSYRVWNSTVLASALIKDLEVFEEKVIGMSRDLGRLLGIRKVGHQTVSPDFVRVELGSSATKHPLLSRYTSYYEIYEGQLELARLIMEKGMGASEIK